MSKRVIKGEEARNAILCGVNTLADAVASTLGPRGRTVLLERPFGPPTSTKDGVTVSRDIDLEDPLENMGAQSLKEVAQKTHQVAGDGTTTATVLGRAIYREGVKVVAAGADPAALKRGIDKAVEAVVGKREVGSTKHTGGALQSLAVPVSGDMIAQVGTISANSDSVIGALIAEAMEKVGSDGIIMVDASHTMETELSVVKGMQFDRGYISHHFITDGEKRTVDYEDPYILLYDKKISFISDIGPILNSIVEKKKPVVIIAEDIDGEALQMLVINKMRGLPVVAIKAPGFGDRRNAMLSDMAVLTGGKVISDEIGLQLKNAKLEDLGTAKRVIVDRDSTTIQDAGGHPIKVEARAVELRDQITKAPSDFDREKLHERLAKLSGGVAVIKVGAATKTELDEKKDRVDDAMHATKAAVEEGIVPGGGTALIRCIPAVQSVIQNLDGDEKIGAAIILKVLEEPLRQICKNAGDGVSGDVVLDRIKLNTGNWGYNAATGAHEDLVESGVIDPAKVCRTALQNAASVAGLLLTTECMVSEIRTKDTAVAMAMPGMGGGM